MYITSLSLSLSLSLSIYIYIYIYTHTYTLGGLPELVGLHASEREGDDRGEQLRQRLGFLLSLFMFAMFISRHGVIFTAMFRCVVFCLASLFVYLFL